MPASESSWSEEQEKLFIIPVIEVAVKPHEVARNLDFRLTPEVRDKVARGNWGLATLMQDPLIQKAMLLTRKKIMSKVTLLVNHGCTYVRILYQQTFTALVNGGDGPNRYDFGLAYVDAGFVGE